VLLLRYRWMAEEPALEGLEQLHVAEAPDPLVNALLVRDREVVDEGAVDEALSARIDALTSSGLVNAAANRRALRIGQEPLEVFRAYMAVFAAEQARCHLSPALVRNLEEHWQAHERTA